VRISPDAEAPNRHRYAYGHTGHTYRNAQGGPSEEHSTGGGQSSEEANTGGGAQRLFGPAGAVVKMDADAAVGRDTGGGAADTEGGPTVALWEEAGVFPSEPVFVPRPEGEAEDDGVLLCLSYDTLR